MFKKLLCWIGIHDYVVVLRKHIDGERYPPKKEICIRCGKKIDGISKYKKMRQKYFERRLERLRIAKEMWNEGETSD